MSVLGAAYLGGMIPQELRVGDLVYVNVHADVKFGGARRGRVVRNDPEFGSFGMQCEGSPIAFVIPYSHVSYLAAATASEPEYVWP